MNRLSEALDSAGYVRLLEAERSVGFRSLFQMGPTELGPSVSYCGLREAYEVAGVVGRTHAGGRCLLGDDIFHNVLLDRYDAPVAGGRCCAGW